MVRMPRNEKQTYQLNSKASNVTIRFDLGHDLVSSYISAKSSPIPTKRKANLSIELLASNGTNGFHLDQNLDLWTLKVKRDLDPWPYTWPWPWIFMVKFLHCYISEWEGRLTLHRGDGSRSLMTMTMTIWWPRSGVWIYQIVTGVTSRRLILMVRRIYHSHEGMVMQSLIVNVLKKTGELTVIWVALTLMWCSCNCPISCVSERYPEQMASLK